MPKIEWDKDVDRLYETGVDHGVLYTPTNGLYTNGVAWNGLTSVNETPSGAEANPVYADNMKYLNLISVEEFGGTIEALYYPDEFIPFDGGVVVNGGVVIGQQGRPKFGLSYRTLLGNAVEAEQFGYKIHCVYGAQATPSERSYTTINDSPEAAPLSWEFTTSPVSAGDDYKPTALVTIDSTKVSSSNLAALELILYGSAGVNPRLPLPSEIIALFSGSASPVTPAEPAYNTTTHVIDIPTTTGVIYYIDDEVVVDDVTLETGESVLVTAQPAEGRYFPSGTDNAWSYSY